MKTILVLEDDPAVMALMRRMLYQYDLIVATTAQQAFRLFSSHGRQIDLLVAGVTLPHHSGIQVALLMRAAIPNLPVILTYGHGEREWTVRDYFDLQRLGLPSVALLSRPFLVQQLLTEIREMTRTGGPEIAKTA